MQTNKWFHRYMQLASHVAQWSKDPDKKVGAVLVGPNNRLVSVGYNGLPEHVCDESKQESKTNYIHAEINCIYNALDIPKDCTMYVTTFPCYECARTIAQVWDIKTVITPGIDSSSSWAQSQRDAFALFENEGTLIINLEKQND